MFDEIQGHDSIKKNLKSQIQNSKVSHAYLFSGPEGIGKQLLATEFAKQLLNTDNLQTCVDYKFIQRLEDKTEITVDQIRKLIIDDVYIAPATGKYKVYIINDAHLMNSSSQNALLKTLEEPPKYVVIILITHNEKTLLTTILSRVNKVPFSSLSDEVVRKIVKKNNSVELVEKQLKHAEGSVKKALQHCKEDNVYTKIEKLYACIKNKDILQAMKQFEDISLKDNESLEYMAYIALQRQDYSFVNIIENTSRRMAQNANEDIVKQALCIRLVREDV